MIASPRAVPSSVLKPFIAAITPAMTSATSRISATYSTVPCAVWIASLRAMWRARSVVVEALACIVRLRCFEWTTPMLREDVLQLQTRALQVREGTATSSRGYAGRRFHAGPDRHQHVADRRAARARLLCPRPGRRPAADRRPRRRGLLVHPDRRPRLLRARRARAACQARPRPLRRRPRALRPDRLVHARPARRAPRRDLPRHRPGTPALRPAVARGREADGPGRDRVGLARAPAGRGAARGGRHA